MAEPILAPGPNSIDEGADVGVLLTCVAAGDREAFHAFYDRYGAQMMAVVRRRVGQSTLAEELSLCGLDIREPALEWVASAGWIGVPGVTGVNGAREWPRMARVPGPRVSVVSVPRPIPPNADRIAKTGRSCFSVG